MQSLLAATPHRKKSRVQHKLEKESFVATAWREYLSFVSRFVPKRLLAIFANRKVLLMLCAILAVELSILVGAYLWVTAN